MVCTSHDPQTLSKQTTMNDLDADPKQVSLASWCSRVLNTWDTTKKAITDVNSREGCVINTTAAMRTGRRGAHCEYCADTCFRPESSGNAWQTSCDTVSYGLGPVDLDHSHNLFVGARSKLTGLKTCCLSRLQTGLHCSSRWAPEEVSNPAVVAGDDEDS